MDTFLGHLHLLYDYLDIDGPESIEGVNDAKEFLNVDPRASDSEIEQAFHEITGDATDETYWKAVQAREIALAGSVSAGKTIYTVLREGKHPEDISSVIVAQNLFDAAPPPQDSRSLHSYNRGISSTATEAIARLKELSEADEPEVDDQNIKAVRVAQHVLRLQDLEKGREYVLGPDHLSSSSS